MGCSEQGYLDESGVRGHESGIHLRDVAEVAEDGDIDQKRTSGPSASNLSVNAVPPPGGSERRTSMRRGNDEEVPFDC